jgi:predicted porin
MNLKYKLLVLLLGLSFSLQAFSAQWILKPILNPSVQYDDNISMSVSDKESSFSYLINPTLLGEYLTERTIFTLSTGYAVERFSSDVRSNEENPFFELSGNRRFLRSTLGVSYSFREQASRDVAAEDTGNFSSQAKIMSRSLSPYFTFNLSETDSFSINLSFSERKYSTNEFRDNETKSISTSWQRQFSERLNGYSSFSYSNFESGDSVSGTDSDNYNLSFGANYQLSERWNIRGAIGVRYLESNIGSISSTNTGSSFDLTAMHQSELGNISVNALRSITPSSNGNVNEQDSVNLNWSKDLSEKLYVSISGRYISTRSATDESENKRQNLNISPSLNWKISPQVTLKVNYRYRQQKRDGQSAAEGNSVNLSFNYDLQGYRFSR